MSDIKKGLRKKIVLGIDLDGTVAKWQLGTPFDALFEKDYYANLEPEEGLISNIKYSFDEGLIEPVVISAYFTEVPYPKEDKIKWCKKHLPFVENIILVPYGQNKMEYAKKNGLKINNNFVMIEDFTQSLNDVVNAGGIGVKFMNGINGTNGTWNGYKLYKAGLDHYDWLLSSYLEQIVRLKPKNF